MAFGFRLTSLARLVGGGGGNGVGVSASRGRLISLTSLCQGKLIPYKLADIGEGIREVTVKEWFIQSGDKVKQFDNICEVQSDKASVTITSRYDGIVKNIHYKIDEICLVGDALMDIEVEDVEVPPTQVQSDEKEDAIVEDSTQSHRSHDHTTFKSDECHNDEIHKDNYYDNKVLTTPAVRKIAKENNVNLKLVKATGRDGRVLKEDILAYLGKVTQKIEKDVGPATTKTSTSGTLNNVLSNKKYAKHMWKSMTQSLTIPHFVYSDECDVSKLVRLRTEVKEAFQSQGINLSYMPFIIKAMSQALLQFPELNALVDESAESINIKKEHNVSLAMDTPGGLVVPNIKNVQDLNIIEIAKELNRLQELGKKSSIPLNDLTGGTISVSNIGIIGGTYTKPVILSPQVVIGAIGKIQKLPRFDEKDNVVAANILTVSWAADHRVIDGVTMAKFSNLWKHYVENPSHLIIGI